MLSAERANIFERSFLGGSNTTGRAILKTDLLQIIFWAGYDFPIDAQQLSRFSKSLSRSCRADDICGIMVQKPDGLACIMEGLEPVVLRRIELILRRREIKQIRVIRELMLEAPVIDGWVSTNRADFEIPTVPATAAQAALSIADHFPHRTARLNL